MPKKDQAQSRTGSTPRPSHSRATGWAASAGVFAFLFFLVKGLLWILVPVVVLAAR